MTTIDDLMDWACEHGITRGGIERFAAEQRAAGAQQLAKSAGRGFDDVWMTLPIPGEFDAMDQCDQQRWRSVMQQAYAAGALAERERCVLPEPKIPPFGRADAEDSGEEGLYSADELRAAVMTERERWRGRLLRALPMLREHAEYAASAPVASCTGYEHDTLANLIPEIEAALGLGATTPPRSPDPTA